MGRMEALQAAARSPCVCQGQWRSFVSSALVANGINIAALCHDTLEALRKGRSQTTPVVVLAGRSGGEGKTMFYNPLHSVFEGEGMVFGLPDKSNFSLLDLPYAKVTFLNKFRFGRQVGFMVHGGPVIRRRRAAHRAPSEHSRPDR